MELHALEVIEALPPSSFNRIMEIMIKRWSIPNTNEKVNPVEVRPTQSISQSGVTTIGTRNTANGSFNIPLTTPSTTELLGPTALLTEILKANPDGIRKSAIRKEFARLKNISSMVEAERVVTNGLAYLAGTGRIKSVYKGGIGNVWVWNYIEKAKDISIEGTSEEEAP